MQGALKNPWFFVSLDEWSGNITEMKIRAMPIIHKQKPPVGSDAENPCWNNWGRQAVIFLVI